MAEKQSSIEDKVREWLESQGYPLEMTVARAFQRGGFRVIQSEYYSDPDSGASRETDVVASLQGDDRQSITRVSFVLECKSNDKPWLLFTGGTGLAGPARVVQRAASKSARALLRSMAQDAETQESSLFHVDSPPAYGMTQAFTSGHDRAYEAVLSVSKASVAEVLDADVRSERRKEPFRLISFPVIVLRGGLFAVGLQSDGALSVQKTSEGTLLWRNAIVKMPHTIVKVITEEALDVFVARVALAAKSFLAAAKRIDAESGSNGPKEA